MATYRNIQISFWTDSKVADDFTPEDKYFYLYLMTNPHTNTCGCYELSIRQMSIETGYAKETIIKLINRMENVHGVIKYSQENKEVLLINWRKYNWTSSERLRKSILDGIKHIKTEAFCKFLTDCFANSDTIFDLGSLPSSVNSDEESSNEPNEAPKKEKEPKKKYGEYNHVKLTDTEYARLCSDYGEEAVKEGIKNVDEYCQGYGKKYTDYNLVLRKWGIKSDKLKPSVVRSVPVEEDDEPSEEWTQQFEGA